ncbi:ribosome recycling factor [[Mycoplasma] testudinis]|uniref:ribosome recycling factor n=1 Tax=[Mycoplasma] testudinis TaxID=33924 RepID=UPI0004824725|nr:ribosome recycling factor [[Mycoplasma] testudinis]
MDLKTYQNFFETAANKKIDWLHTELSKIRSGRANLKMLDGIRVEYYGEMTPLNQMAQIQIPEPRELLIKPFDPSTVGMIQGALSKSDLNLNPTVDGDKIRIKLPQLTSETRQEYVKKTKQIGEKTRQELRMIRRDTLQKIKSDKHADEDFEKFLEGEVEKFVKKFNSEVDAILAAKEKDLTTL